MSTTTMRRLADALAIRAEQWGERIAHIAAGGELSYKSWNEQADEIGGGLAAAGVQPGDRLLLPITNENALGMATAYMGAHRAGAICAPLNTRWTPAEARDFAQLVGAKWAITDTPEVLKDAGLQHIWTLNQVPRNRAALPDQAALPADVDCDIVPTSGTTGRSKGVVATEEEMVTSMRGLQQSSATGRLQHAMPITAYGGLHGLILLPLRDGTTVINYPKFDVEGFLRSMAEHKVNSLMIVPAMFRLLVDHPLAATLDLSALRWVVCGSAALPIDTVDRAAKVWPNVKVLNTFGATELGSGNRTRISPRLLREKPGSIGKPMLDGGCQVRAKDGAVLPVGEIGELWFKSTGKARRYWGDDASTSATWKDGWVTSGDLGYIDADGDIFITGRSKEMIIRGGYNIAPPEIEQLLHAYPGVKEAAVVGIPHEVLGQDVAAAIVPETPGAVDVEALQAWLKDKLADYKRPRKIVFLEELPHNAMGKVVKPELLPTLIAAASAQAPAK